MKFSDKGIMTVAGTIRGAIAFGLAVSLQVNNEFHKSLLISGTLVLVILTTLVFGAIMPFTIKFLKSYDNVFKPDDSNKDLVQVINNSTQTLEKVHKEPEVKHSRIYEFLHPNFHEK